MAQVEKLTEGASKVVLEEVTGFNKHYYEVYFVKSKVANMVELE